MPKSGEGDDQDELGIPGSAEEQQRQQVTRADRQQTGEEFRASLNPFHRDLYDSMGERDDNRKRKSVEGDDGSGSGSSTNEDDGDDEDRRRPRMQSETPDRTIRGENLMGGIRRNLRFISSNPAKLDPRVEDSTREDWPARGGNIISPSPPAPSSNSASSPPSKRVKTMNLKDYPPSSLTTKARTSAQSIKGTSLDPNWKAEALPQREAWDVPEGTRTRGLASLYDESHDYIRKWGWRMVEFVRSDHGYEDGWIGVKPLGKGSFGRAGLWEKRDEHGKVVDVRLSVTLRFLPCSSNHSSASVHQANQAEEG